MKLSFDGVAHSVRTIKFIGCYVEIRLCDRFHLFRIDLIICLLADQDFPGIDLDDLVDQVFPLVCSADGRQVHLTCGNVTVCKPDGVFSGIDRGDVVVFFFLQHIAGKHRTRRHDPDDFPLYKTFRSGRIFCLFTDGDLVSLFDEPRDIGVCRMKRHAAHGCALFQSAVLPGQSQFQLS